MRFQDAIRENWFDGWLLMESWSASESASRRDTSIKVLSPPSSLQFIVALIIDHVAMTCLRMPAPVRSLGSAVTVSDVRSASSIMSIIAQPQRTDSLCLCLCKHIMDCLWCIINWA